MRRVVITGLGVVSPIGIGKQAFFEGLQSETCAIAPITLFDASSFKMKLAAEVHGFDPGDFMDKKDARRAARFTQFALSAAQLCLTDSGIHLEEADRDAFGVLISSGVGGLDVIENECAVLRDRGPDRVSPLLVPKIIVNMAAGSVAMRYGLHGMCSCPTTACASSTNSIGDAFRLIQWGQADRMLAGGAEASITPLGMAGFINITALSGSSDPARASIPFDKERSGFVMGEGAGVVLLEEYELARARRAHIYAEVLGYGATCDAYHITAPAPDGAYAARCMSLALKEAKLPPEKLSYINAHGTSTPPNDAMETRAIRTALGDCADKVPVSSTKSSFGHLLGAAGAVEAIVCALAIENSYIPPTLGFRVPDPDCDLDIVPNVGRKQAVQYTLSNSFGFGGHNASLLLGREE